MAKNTFILHDFYGNNFILKKNIIDIFHD